jgi:2-hydroxychromene-2-carboxylate isomerase
VAAIELYFDFTSPYSYLACKRIEAEQDFWFSQHELSFKPIMIGKVFSMINSTGPGEVKAKREYLFKDVLSKAARLEIPLRSPARMPFNPLGMLRFVDALSGDKRQLEFIIAAFEYGWKLGLDYEDYSGFKNYIVEQTSITSAEYDSLESNKNSRRNLKANINSAVQEGVFGVPSFFVKGELYWGLDSISALKSFINSGETLYEKDEFDRFVKILEGDKDE